MNNRAAATTTVDLASALPPARGRLGISTIVKNLSPAVAVLVLAAIVQSIYGTSNDVSWLITLCERTLDGQRPYVDFIEFNPPAAIYVYWPATAVARLLGLRPELTVAFFGFFSIVVSLFFCAKILSRSKLDISIGPGALAFAAMVLALLPGRAFDQREHMAVIFGLPFFAALVARAPGADIGVASRWLAGFCGALMMSIKPYFALMVLPILPYLFWRLGLKRFLSSLEFYVAACFLALYAAMVASCFPTYVAQVAPMAAAIYVPIRAPLAVLAFGLGTVCWMALGAILVVFDRRRIAENLTAVPALGSVGALVAFFIQGKGWPYHIYPAVALIALAAGPLIIRAATSPRLNGRLVILIGSAITLARAFALFSQGGEDTSQLERVVSALAPHPKILQIGPDIALGHPLTRHVSGLWVGTPCALWITAMASALLQSSTIDETKRRRYESYLEFDRATLVADIRTRSPDAILIDGDMWEAWAFAHPDVAVALADYAPVGAVGEVKVYGRKLGLRPSQIAQ